MEAKEQHMAKNSISQNSISITALTAGSLLFKEFDSISHILFLPDPSISLNTEVLQNQFLQIKSQSSRKRIITEIKRRFVSVDLSFWEFWVKCSIAEKRLALLYVVLKTYPIAFDLHFEVTIPRWKSKRLELNNFDFQMRIDELASQGHIAVNWSDTTINKTISHYMTSLREAGLMKKVFLQAPPTPSKEFYAFMAKHASPWIFDACFLSKIENVKHL